MAEASLDHGGPDPTLDLPGCEGLTESTFYDKVLSVDDIDVGPEALEERLAEIRRLRQVARQSMLTQGWGILTLWGAAFVVSVPVAYLLEGDLRLYWSIVAGVGGIASFVIGRRADVTPRRSGWPYLVTSVVMFAGAFGAFWVFEDLMAILVWFAALTGGFIVLTALDEQWYVLAWLAGLLAWGVVMYLLIDEPGALYAALAGSLGATLVGAGTAFGTVRA
jgi:hypothetical protein